MSSDKNLGLIYSMSDKDIMDMIKEYLPVRNKEKKDNGEVFTPYPLIDEMLDKLPDEVWTNPNLKWLDPANGIGNFPMVVYSRLMKSLEGVKGLKDKLKRHNHIIKNMLYMVELIARNVEISRRIFGEEANIYCGDFLKEDWKEEFEIEEFDIVIGNPPFQDYQETKTKRGGGDLLWNKFVILSLEILINNGFLVFVHPPGWRKPESDKSKYKNLFKLMTYENDMLYLEIHNTKDGMKIFKSGTRYDWYIIRKSNKNILTNIIGEDDIKVNINLKEYDFLPNYNFENVFSLVAINDEPRCKIIFSASSYETRKEWVNDKKNDKYKYLLVHSTPKSGIRYMYSSRDDKGHFGISKVIFGETGICNAVIDLEGKYGMTQGAMAIEVRNKLDGEKLKKYLESDEFNNILSACSWSNYRIDWRLFTFFKKDFWK